MRVKKNENVREMQGKVRIKGEVKWKDEGSGKDNMGKSKEKVKKRRGKRSRMPMMMMIIALLQIGHKCTETRTHGHKTNEMLTLILTLTLTVTRTNTNTLTSGLSSCTSLIITNIDSVAASSISNSCWCCDARSDTENGSWTDIARRAASLFSAGGKPIV